MRKLAPGRVSYRDDFSISYRVYIMTGSFHMSLFEGKLHVEGKLRVEKIHVISRRRESHPGVMLTPTRRFENIA